MTDTTPLLRVDRLSKTLGGREVLRDISFDLAEGQVLSIVGPSGAGKSTLLQCLNHLIDVDSGRVLLRGGLVGYEEERGRLFAKRRREVARDRASFGFVFQQFNLFPHLSALENIAAGLINVRRIPRRQALAKALEWLEVVGLSEFRNAYPSQLSGGQQQRVAIARATAMEPDVLLFDEPTSALDPELVSSVLAVIERLAASGATMIIVTHELEFARRVSDLTLVLEAGSVIDFGPTEAIFSGVSSPRTRSFLQTVHRGHRSAVEG
ncbi:MAG: amino acid ABC transporter ATP-binding protein [Pseudoclavibacter sp.]